MNPPENFKRIVNGLRYSVENATLIASDAYWDGNNWERKGRNQFLYKTSNGRFFVVKLTQWQGEKDALIPVEEDQAILMYENDLPEHEVEYEEAFPDIPVEDA